MCKVVHGRSVSAVGRRSESVGQPCVAVRVHTVVSQSVGRTEQCKRE